jgi:predicted DNA-binding protein (UPF0251 family)/predicted Fe-Mo cluster-binding NifX family protein
MARPSRCRRICTRPKYCSFAPENAEKKENVVLTVDEYETVRLIDLEDMTQEQTAKQMDISRTTVMEIYRAARRKIADCIVNGKTLTVSGGNYRICDGTSFCGCQTACRKRHTVQKHSDRERGIAAMKIAVTYEDGEVFQHFGHTEQFKIYDIENGKIASEQVVSTNGQGHGALAGFLSQQQVDTVICGGIGGGAVAALANAGIQVYGGAAGNTDDAVKQLLEGQLAYDPEPQCGCHEEGHSCGEHACGEDPHGCSGN